MEEQQQQQKVILAILAVLALVAGIGWGYTLASAPPAAAGPPEPVPPVVDGGEVAQDYATTAFTSGRRWIRCRTDRADLLPDGHLVDTEHDAGLLYGFVHSESGSALLWDPDGRPELQAVWHHAEVGGEGTCNTQPPEILHLPGSMEGATSGSVVSSCSDALAEVDNNGAFKVDVLVGHPCTLWFVGEGPSGKLVARKRLVADPGAVAVNLRAD